MEKILEKLIFFWSKTNRWHRVILIFLVAELKLIPGGRLGFQCNDPALSHPFTGDTISWKWLLAITLTLPLPIMLVAERKNKINDSSKEARQQVLYWYKEYLYGALINLTIVQVLKLLVGSPRPHFFDTCKPEEALTCEESEYISSYTCTKSSWLSQSDKSFPSGHTSLALHSAIFIVYYLYRRAASHLSHGVWVRGTQALTVCGAFWCSVSRMTDHRHHWWDVLAGALIAALVSAYTILTLCKNFECTNPKDVVDKPAANNHSNIQTVTTT